MTISISAAAVGRPLRVPSDARALMAFSGRDDDVAGAGNVSLVVGEGRPRTARAALVGTVGLAPGDAVFMEQVHGGRVAVVDAGHRGRGAGRHEDALGGVDGLVTWAEDTALVVMVADCVPVLLVDPAGAVAAVHAGRRGVTEGIVAATVAAMQPADPSAVVALIGPAIGGCCYEVPGALAGEVAEQVAVAASRTTWDTPSLDLPRAVEAQLRELGIGEVAQVSSCTRCGPGRWFSHRADPGKGRQAAVVCRRSTVADHVPGVESLAVGTSP